MLAVDMVRMAERNEYDTAYLLSADGDFTPAVKAVAEKGKKVFAASATPMSWVMTRVVVRSSAFISSRRSRTRLWMVASSPVVGSSAMSTFGRAARVMAIEDQVDVGAKEGDDQEEENELGKRLHELEEEVHRRREALRPEAGENAEEGAEEERNEDGKETGEKERLGPHHGASGADVVLGENRLQVTS
jgi:hypothetical protein